MPTGSGTSPIFEQIARHDFDGGVDLFRALEAPSPEDECWAGLCLLALGQPLEAQAVLLRARGRRFALAGAVLATAHRQLGDLERCHEALASVHEPSLDAFGAALLAREWGQYRFACGDPTGALESTERAWVLASGAEQGELLLAGIAVGLGMAYRELGFDGRAIGYLRQALDHPGNRGKPYLWSMLGTCLTADSQFGAATAAFDQAMRVAANNPAVLCVAHYLRGTLEKAKGSYREASSQLEQAVRLARASNERETECFAHIELLAIATSDGDLPRAQQHLARAAFLANTERLRAYLLWREGALEVRTEQCGLEKLEASLAFFRRGGAQREIGLLHLHLAEAHLRAGEPATAHMALRQALEVRHAISSGALLAAELRSLPRVFELISQDAAHPLLEDWRSLEACAPIQVELRTLGEAGLFVDGAVVKLKSGLEKTVEVLAYLLKHGMRTLEQVQTDVFGSSSPKQARNYFHMLRSTLKKAIPGLEVRNLSGMRYAIFHPGLRLNHDRDELQRSLSAGGETGFREALRLYRGPFLPTASSEWAEKERGDVEWSVVRAGLEILEEYYCAGRYAECLELAERLLEIAPTNVGINDLVVRATFSLSGAVAARQALVRVMRRFQEEFGEVPEEICRLGSKIPIMN